jgi:glucosylceramidase
MNRTHLFLLLITICFILACTSEKPKYDYTTAEIIQSSKAGELFVAGEALTLTKISNQQTNVVTINPQKTYQKIEGIGGAFTESSAYALNQLSEEKRQEVLNAYFSQDGANYSLMRTHFNSCDFSLSYYTYADTKDDTMLSDFSVEDDLDDLVPLIKDAQKISTDGFKLLASPWTAPPWMKENNGWKGGSLKKEFYSTWALFFSKYIKAYKELGIPVWAVTVENEPMGNGGQWESMEFRPEQMVDFVKNNLGPQFKKDGLGTKILIYDQNRDHLLDWTNAILSDPEVCNYVWGTAVHWYSSTVEWYSQVLDSVHRKFPDKPLMQTEGCIDSEIPVWQDDAWYWTREATDWGYTWAPEEDKHLHPKYAPVYRYARDLIGGLNSWLSGWIDWNIVLDDKGGPNHANNWCVAPVIVKPETDEVYYTPLYYVMKHFSKFFRPGAVRIETINVPEPLMITACKNPDNSIAVAVLNQSDEPHSFQLSLQEKVVSIEIPGDALQTVILK